MNHADDAPLLRLRDLTKHFPLQKGVFEKMAFRNGRIQWISQTVHAVNGVSLDIRKGETLALVGESGCGKSTLAKTVIGLHVPTAGQVLYDGQDIGRLIGAARKPYRKKIQIIFQDPFSSLNPRKKVLDIIGRPIDVHRLAAPAERSERVAALLEKVGLSADYAERYPHQFSGGQRQRIGIARALASEPELVIADEPISALDVSIQAQILNLMMDLQAELSLTYLFVSHDLSVVRHIANRVAVMYLGFILELGSTEDLFGNPMHPYTQMLFSAIPSLETLVFEDRFGLQGEVPTPIQLPMGCVFHPRCPMIMDRCRVDRPLPKTTAPGRWAACHLYGDP